MATNEKEIMMAEIPIVRFQIENVEFGLDVYQIRDIIRLDDVTRVPNCADYIMGVINLRGQIIPVINLRKRLSFDNIDYKGDVRILIVEFGEEVAGLLVDSVSEVMMLASHNIEPRPRYLVNNIDANYLVGLGLKQKTNTFANMTTRGETFTDSEFILLLDLAKILNATVKEKEKSLISKIVDRKSQLLEEERARLKKEILQLKAQQKDQLKSSLQTTVSTTKNTKAATEKSFAERQTEVIKKIQTSQGSKLSFSTEQKDGKGVDAKVKKLTSDIKALNKDLLTPAEEIIGKSKKKKVIRKVIVKKKKSKSAASNQTKNLLESAPQIGKLEIAEEVQSIPADFQLDQTSFKTLNEMQLSLIQEIGNIGAGNAATALSSMIDRRVDISVPRVEIEPTEKLNEVLGGSETLSIAIYLAVEGDVSMYMMLVFDRPSGLRLSDMLLFQERPEEELLNGTVLDQMDESALMEVGNILGSHYLTALSEFTGMHMIPGPPSLAYDMLGSIIDFVQIELEEKVDNALILNTDIMVEAQKIEGYILILPIPESITSLIREMGL